MAAVWVDQLENSNSNPGAGTFFFLIDDTHFFLIDDTYKLIIEDGSTPGPVTWTDQVEN